MMNTEAGSHEVIAQALAKNLREFRERQGLSINELAKIAGVGKATLSVLENGNGNPNIETIWALSSALKIPFGRLIDTTSSEMRVVRKSESIEVNTGDKEVVAGLLASRTNRGAFELYFFDLAKGAKRVAKPHTKGTTEHVFVKKGKLRVGPIENPFELNTGDLATFPADVPHVYEAIGGDTSTLVLMDYR